MTLGQESLLRRLSLGPLSAAELVGRVSWGNTWRSVVRYAWAERQEDGSVAITIAGRRALLNRVSQLRSRREKKKKARA